MILEIILGFILILLLYNFIWEETPKDFPPGPKRLRYFGNIHQFAKYGKIPQFHLLEKFSKIYGNIVGVKFGVSSQIILNDYELIKQVLCSDVWVDRFFDKYVSQSFGNLCGIIFADGDSWKEIRRFTLKNLKEFGFGKQKSMELSIEEELSDLLSRTNAKIDSGSSVFDMRGFFNISVLNLLWSLMSGEKFSHDNEKIQYLLHLIRETSINFPVEGNPLLVFPFLRILDPFTRKGKFRRQIYKKMGDFFKEILDTRRKEGYYKQDQRDFFDVFINEIEKKRNLKTDQVNYFTDEQFEIVAFDLFAAGADTTSNTLEFSILFMIMNPHVQKIIQEEIDLVVGRERFPSTLDKPNMPYTEATLLEVQRMANIIPIIIRSPIADTTLAGYNIPKGTLGALNIHSMHMNEKIWGNPKTFRPERFLEKTNDGFKIINAHKILPFGLGKRVCIGEVLARASLFTYFTTLLQRFNFSLPSGHSPLTDEPQVGFTLSPHEYSAQITPR